MSLDSRLCFPSLDEWDHPAARAVLYEGVDLGSISWSNWTDCWQMPVLHSDDLREVQECTRRQARGAIMLAGAHPLGNAAADALAVHQEWCYEQVHVDQVYPDDEQWQSHWKEDDEPRPQSN